MSRSTGGASTAGWQTPRKRFGQHFLHDPAVIGRIIAVLQPQAGQHIVEIGPGRGALTLPLLQAIGTLDAVELDRDLIPALTARSAMHGQLTVHCADALSYDFCRLAGQSGKLRIVGNLPYNISTPLLFRLFDQKTCIGDMHFMLQKEVVDRIVATPGSGAYGRLSVMVQYHCAATRLFTIGPGAFTPPPRVDSAVVRLTPYAAPPVAVADEAQFARLVTLAFSQRRKTLRNSVKTLLSDADITGCGIDGQRRAETLSLAEFAALANAVSAKPGG